MDTSYLYKLIEVGDTLTNEPDSTDFQINSDTTIALDFGVKCTEALKKNSGITNASTADTASP